VLVVVVVLDCLPRQADRGGRRARARLGRTPPLLYRARRRRRAGLLASPGGPSTSTIRKNPAGNSKGEDHTDTNTDTDTDPTCEYLDAIS
jgi:hypothetical protein